jgi:uncharacterized RDD family membrane protein YckC
MAPAAPVKRLAAWGLDALIVGIVLVPLNPRVYSRQPSAALFFALVVPAVLLAFVCLVGFDGGKRGATPGTRVMRIRVADAKTGRPIGYRRATRRRIAYVVGALVFYLGWLWILFDSRRQAWHDKFAHSVVVEAHGP